MDVITKALDLRARLQGVGTVVLVPTMGNLHEGHLQLMRIARGLGDCVVASIFVNRLQFGVNEDFDRYPRTFEADCAGLQQEAVDVVFTPQELEMYPLPQTYRVSPPPLAAELEGAFRPGFFDGVCTVVLKLFNLVGPDFAVFGKKDRQQLAIVSGMVQQFNLPIRIIPADTIRASDGLALSSRNNYLSAPERSEAPRLYRTLRTAADELARENKNYSAIEMDATSELARNGWRVDYVAIRDAADLGTPSTGKQTGELVVLGAALLGSTRLIDNVDMRL